MVQKSLFEEDSKMPSIIEKEAQKILIAKLSNWKEYVSLPEFGEIIKLLEKGVAVHHSGVTPVFREMIEILYRKGYIKLLVATETFAIGVNVAIKSVIYTGLQKYDGKGFRYLYSHEYSQGSGRAGRRGKDTRGVVIHLMNVYDRRDSVPDAGECRSILSGNPENLTSKFCVDFKLIISMLASNNNKIIEYVNSSMLSDEISNRLERFYSKKTELNNSIVKINDSFQYLRNSIEILKEYHDDTIKINLSSKKQRKKLNRKILNAEQDNKGLVSDYKKYKEFLSLRREVEKNDQIIKNTKNYVGGEISLHIKILEQEGFIEDSNISVKGMMATNLHEIHPLAVSDLLCSGEFDSLTVEELVSVLSVFTHIKISEEQSYVDVNNTNVNDTIKSVVKNIKKSLNKYYDIETKHQTNFTDSYDIQYDMCEFMYKWCFAENETDCKLIYNEAKKYNIYMGEFVKAILKIVNVCNELEKAAVVQENLKLIHTLSLVRDKVLKSVATNQSLYV